MVKEIVKAPIDHIGMPLPILYTSLPPGIEDSQNKHHAFFQRTNFLNGTEGTRAVRFSRIQLTPQYLHDRFHKSFNGGVDIPKNEYEEFKLTILGFAGYLPLRGVDLSRSDARTVNMTHDQKRELRLPGTFVTEADPTKQNEIGSFLVSYAVRHGLNNVDKDLIGSFLEETDEEKRLSQGLKIIERAAEVAVEPFELVYKAACRRGALKRGITACPHKLIKKHLKSNVPAFTDVLKKELTAVLA